ACRSRAISFRLLQKASSRLMLVLCPAITTERLTIKDFMSVSRFVDCATVVAIRYLRGASTYRAKKSEHQIWCISTRNWFEITNVDFLSDAVTQILRFEIRHRAFACGRISATVDCRLILT